MRLTGLACACLLLTCGGLAAADDVPPAPRYTIRQDTPDTGSHINRNVVSGSAMPFDKRYSELTAEQKQLFKTQYEAMADDDEPPYPINGLGHLYKSIAAAQQKLLVQGLMVLHVDIDSQGNATSVSVLQSPSPHAAEVFATLLMIEKYKPAVCGGMPCAMAFPFRVDFKKR